MERRSLKPWNSCSLQGLDEAKNRFSQEPLEEGWPCKHPFFWSTKSGDPSFWSSGLQDCGGIPVGFGRHVCDNFLCQETNISSTSQRGQLSQTELLGLAAPKESAFTILLIITNPVSCILTGPNFCGPALLGILQISLSQAWTCPLRPCFSPCSLWTLSQPPGSNVSVRCELLQTQVCAIASSCF